MAQYRLAHHVFSCVRDRQVVLLDLKQNRYFLLDATKVGAFTHLIHGWPADWTSPDSPEIGRLSHLISTLLQRGMLTTVLREGWDAVQPVQLASPAIGLIDEQENLRPRIRASDLFAFLVAAGYAKFALHFLPFERIISRVRLRRMASASDGNPPSVERLRELVEIFLLLRIFLFSSRNACLFNSLTLLEFLARYRVLPDWVFGVQVTPFAAHCWLQWENLILNDSLETVCGYTPIMKA
ncbi:lasso peptide biosynthesis B2 protein [Pandoraea sp. NPDC087047]|uniref:lasso peptide biosynthesis B2 protein n=1 Tax=Pandoraea sp. NPDC087047 TaxID=3364390 RepID=UPI0037F87014